MQGIATGFQNVNTFVKSIKKQPNAHGLMNVMIEPLNYSFDTMKSIAGLLRFQRNPLLLYYNGNIDDFKTFELAIDAGFYVLDNENSELLYSLHKIDSKMEKMVNTKINWTYESDKLG